MNYTSTRDKNSITPLSKCIINGLAPDGGLYVPCDFPQYNIQDFDKNINFADFATQFLSPFFAEDPLLDSLADICQQAFNFPLPSQDINDSSELLELFHGPTNAFKDFGARFLAGCLERLGEREKLVLVATSGDTGGAVASAFFKKKNCTVALLFPKGGVSARQKAQLTGWGHNIKSFQVEGTFDDCQKLVKEAFTNKQLHERYELTSANSINIARLLPQMSYFAYTAFKYNLKHEKACGFIVPTGNMGNVVGAFWARKCGFPIREIVIATNANATVKEFYESNEYKPRPSVKTLANAMDVGAPSNLERLKNLYPDLEVVKEFSQVFLVDDETIKESISKVYKDLNMSICPHTATAFKALQLLNRDGWILAATAHPAKFYETVEPLTGKSIALPEQIAELLERPEDHKNIKADLKELVSSL